MNRLIKTLTTCHLSKEELVSLLEPVLSKKHTSALPWVDVAKRVLTKAVDTSSEVLLRNATTIITMHLEEAVRRGIKKLNLSRRYSEELNSLLSHLHITLEDTNLPTTETHNLSALILAAIIDTTITSHKRGEEASVVSQIFMKLTFIFGHSQEQVLNSLLHCKTLTHPSSRQPSVLVPLIKRLFSTLSCTKSMSPDLYLKYLLLGKLWLFMTEKRELSQTRTYIAKVLKAPGNVRQWGENRGIPWLALPHLSTRRILKNMTLCEALETFYGRDKEATESCDAIWKKNKKSNEKKNGLSDTKKSKEKAKNKGDHKVDVAVPEKLYTASIAELVTDEEEEEEEGEEGLDFIDNFFASDRQKERTEMSGLSRTKADEFLASLMEQTDEEREVVGEEIIGADRTEAEINLFASDTEQESIGKQEEEMEREGTSDAVDTESITLASDEESKNSVQKIKGKRNHQPALTKQKREVQGKKMAKSEVTYLRNKVPSLSNEHVNSIDNKQESQTATRKCQTTDELLSLAGNKKGRGQENEDVEKGEKRKGSEEVTQRVKKNKQHKTELEICEENDSIMKEEKISRKKLMKTKLEATETDGMEARKETKTIKKEKRAKTTSESLNTESKKKKKGKNNKEKLHENELQITDTDCRGAKKNGKTHNKGKMNKIPSEDSIKERKVNGLEEPDKIQPHMREINPLKDQNMEEATDLKHSDSIQPHMRGRKSINKEIESIHKSRLMQKVKSPKRLNGTDTTEYSPRRKTGGQEQLVKASSMSPERAEVEMKALGQNKLLKKLQRIRQKSMTFTVTALEVKKGSLTRKEEQENEWCEGKKLWKKSEIGDELEVKGTDFKVEGDGSGIMIQVEAELSEGKLRRKERKKKLKNRRSLEAKKESLGQMDDQEEKPRKKKKSENGKYSLEGESLGKKEGKNEMLGNISDSEVKDNCLAKNKAMSEEFKNTRSEFEVEKGSIPKNEPMNDELKTETSGFEVGEDNLPKNKTTNEVKSRSGIAALSITQGERAKLKVLGTGRTHVNKPMDSNIEVIHVAEPKSQDLSSDKFDLILDASSSYNRSNEGETELLVEKEMNTSEESLDGSECNPTELSDNESLNERSDSGEKRALFEILSMDERREISTSEESVEGSECHLELLDNESLEEDGKRDNSDKKKALSKIVECDKEMSTSEESVEESECHLKDEILDVDDERDNSDKKKAALSEILEWNKEISTSEESNEGSECHLEGLSDNERSEEDGRRDNSDNKIKALSEIQEWDRKEISTSEESLEGSECHLEELLDYESLEKDGRGHKNDERKTEPHTSFTEAMGEISRGKAGVSKIENAADTKLINSSWSENAKEKLNRRQEKVKEVQETKNTGSSYITARGENARDWKTEKMHSSKITNTDSDSEIEVVLDEVSLVTSPVHQGLSMKLREETVQREVERILKEEEEELKRQNRKPSPSMESPAEVKEENETRMTSQEENTGQIKSSSTIGKHKGTKTSSTDKTMKKREDTAHDSVSKMMNNFYKRKPVNVRRDGEIEIEMQKKSGEKEKQDETTTFETKPAENDNENQKTKLIDSKSLTTSTSSIPEHILKETTESIPEEDAEFIEVLECEGEIDSVLENIIMDTGRVASIEGLRERLLSESNSRETMKESDGNGVVVKEGEEKRERESKEVDGRGEKIMEEAKETEEEREDENGEMEDNDIEETKEEKDEESIREEKGAKQVEKIKVEDMEKDKTQESERKEVEKSTCEGKGTKDKIDSKEMGDKRKIANYRVNKDDNESLETEVTRDNVNIEENGKETGKDNKGEKEVKEERGNKEKGEGADNNEEEMKRRKKEEAEEINNGEQKFDEEKGTEEQDMKGSENISEKGNDEKIGEKESETSEIHLNLKLVNDEKKGENESETSEINLNLSPRGKTNPSQEKESKTSEIHLNLQLVNGEKKGEKESETSEVHLNVSPSGKTNHSQESKSLTDTCSITLEEEGNDSLVESFLSDRNQMAGIRELRKHLLSRPLKAEDNLVNLGEREKEEEKKESGEVNKLPKNKTTDKEEGNGNQDTKDGERKRKTQSPIHDGIDNIDMEWVLESKATLNTTTSPDKNPFKIEVKYEPLDEISQDDAMKGYGNMQREGLSENEAIMSDIKSSPGTKVMETDVKLEISSRTTRKERKPTGSENKGGKQIIETRNASLEETADHSNREQLVERGTMEKSDKLIRGQELTVEMEGKEKKEDRSEKGLESREKMVEKEEGKNQAEEPIKEKEQKEKVDEGSKIESEKREEMGEKILEASPKELKDKVEEKEGERSKTQGESPVEMGEKLGERKEIMEQETDREKVTENQREESTGEFVEEIMKNDGKKNKNRQGSVDEKVDKPDRRKEDSHEEKIEKESRRKTKQLTDETAETVNGSISFTPSTHINMELESTLDELTEKLTDEAYEASSDASEDSAPRTRRRSRLRKACIHPSASDSDSSPVRALSKQTFPLNASTQHRCKRKRSQSCCDSQSSEGSKRRDSVGRTFIVKKENTNRTFTLRRFYDSESSLPSQTSLLMEKGIARQGVSGSSSTEAETSKGRGASMERRSDLCARRKSECQYCTSVNKARTEELCISASPEKRTRTEPHILLSSAGKKRTTSKPCFTPSTKTRTSKTPPEPPFPPSSKSRTPKTASEPSFSTSPKIRTPQTPPFSPSTLNRTPRTTSETSLLSQFSDKSTELFNTSSSSQTNLADSELEKASLESDLQLSASYAEEEQAFDDGGSSMESSGLSVDVKLQDLPGNDRQMLSDEINNGEVGELGRSRCFEKCTYKHKISVENNDDGTEEFFEGEEMEVLSSGIDEDEDDARQMTPEALDNESDDNARKNSFLISKKSLRSHIRQLYTEDTGTEDGEARGARKLTQALVKVQRLSEVALTKEVLISPDVSDEECELVSPSVDMNALKYPDLGTGNDPFVSNSLLSPRGIRSPEKIIPEEQDETALSRNIEGDSHQPSSVKRAQTSVNLHSYPSTQVLRKPTSEEQDKIIDLRQESLPKSAKKSKSQSSPSLSVQTPQKLTAEQEENETQTPINEHHKTPTHRRGTISTSPFLSTQATPHKPTPEKDETRPLGKELHKTPTLRNLKKLTHNPPHKATPEQKENAKSRDSDLPKSPMKKGKLSPVSAFENYPARRIQTRRSSREMLSSDLSNFPQTTNTHQPTKNQSHTLKPTSNTIEEEESGILGSDPVLQATVSLPDGPVSPKRKDSMGDSSRKHGKEGLCKNSPVCNGDLDSGKCMAGDLQGDLDKVDAPQINGKDLRSVSLERLLIEGGNRNIEVKPQKRKSLENNSYEEQDVERKGRRTRLSSQNQNTELREETSNRESPEKGKERMAQRRKSTENITTEDNEGEKKVKRTRLAAQTRNIELSSEEVSDESKESKLLRRKSTENTTIKENEGEKRGKRTRAQTRNIELSIEEVSDESKERKLQRRKNTENTTVEENEGEKRGKRRLAAQTQKSELSSEETSDKDSESKERKPQTKKILENTVNEENEGNRNSKRIKVTVVKEDELLRVSHCDQPASRSSRKRSASVTVPARPLTPIRRSSRLMKCVVGSPLTMKNQGNYTISSTSSESEGETQASTRSTHTATIRS